MAKLKINLCQYGDLLHLPQIDQEMADAIIVYREIYGNLTLDIVAGIPGMQVTKEFVDAVDFSPKMPGVSRSFSFGTSSGGNDWLGGWDNLHTREDVLDLNQDERTMSRKKDPRYKSKQAHKLDGLDNMCRREDVKSINLPDSNQEERTGSRNYKSKHAITSNSKSKHGPPNSNNKFDGLDSMCIKEDVKSVDLPDSSGHGERSVSRNKDPNYKSKHAITSNTSHGLLKGDKLGSLNKMCIKEDVKPIILPDSSHGERSMSRNTKCKEPRYKSKHAITSNTYHGPSKGNKLDRLDNVCIKGVKSVNLPDSSQEERTVSRNKDPRYKSKQAITANTKHSPSEYKITSTLATDGQHDNFVSTLAMDANKETITSTVTTDVNEEKISSAFTKNRNKEKITSTVTTYRHKEKITSTVTTDVSKEKITSTVTTYRHKDKSISPIMTDGSKENTSTVTTDGHKNTSVSVNLPKNAKDISRAAKSMHTAQHEDDDSAVHAVEKTLSVPGDKEIISENPNDALVPESAKNKLEEFINTIGSILSVITASQKKEDKQEISSCLNSKAPKNEDDKGIGMCHSTNNVNELSGSCASQSENKVTEDQGMCNAINNDYGNWNYNTLVEMNAKQYLLQVNGRDPSLNKQPYQPLQQQYLTSMYQQPQVLMQQPLEGSMYIQQPLEESMYKQQPLEESMYKQQPLEGSMYTQHGGSYTMSPYYQTTAPYMVLPFYPNYCTPGIASPAQPQQLSVSTNEQLPINHNYTSGTQNLDLLGDIAVQSADSTFSSVGLPLYSNEAMGQIVSSTVPQNKDCGPTLPSVGLPYSNEAMVQNVSTTVPKNQDNDILSNTVMFDNTNGKLLVGDSSSTLHGQESNGCSEIVENSQSNTEHDQRCNENEKAKVDSNCTNAVQDQSSNGYSEKADVESYHTIAVQDQSSNGYSEKADVDSHRTIAVQDQILYGYSQKVEDRCVSILSDCSYGGNTSLEDRHYHYSNTSNLNYVYSRKWSRNGKYSKISSRVKQSNDSSLYTNTPYDYGNDSISNPSGCSLGKRHRGLEVTDAVTEEGIKKDQVSSREEPVQKIPKLDSDGSMHKGEKRSYDDEKLVGLQCPVSGCSETSNDPQLHCFENHIPSGLWERSAARNTEKVALAIRTLTSWIIGPEMHPLDLVHFLNRSKSLNIPTTMSDISVSYDHTMRQLCTEQRWAIPNQFSLNPVNSPAALVHWRLLAVLLGFLTPTEKVRFRELFRDEGNQDDKAESLLREANVAIETKNSRNTSKKPTAVNDDRTVENITIFLTKSPESTTVAEDEIPHALDMHFYLDRTRDELFGKYSSATSDDVVQLTPPPGPSVEVKQVGGIEVYSDPDQYPRLSRLSRNPRWKVAVGLHPSKIQKFTSGKLQQLKDLLASPAVNALGEIGLDRTMPFTTWQKKNTALITVLKLCTMDKPLILHVRGINGDVYGSDARNLLFHTVKQYCNPQQRMHLHNFYGSAEEVKQWQNEFINCYFGFTGEVTYFDARQLEALQTVPSDRILIETNSPYLSVHCNVWTNTPAYIGDVAEQVARALKMTTRQLVNVTVTNAVCLYHSVRFQCAPGHDGDNK